MGGSYSSVDSSTDSSYISKEQFDKIVIDVALEVNNVSLQDVNAAVDYAWHFGSQPEHSKLLWEYKRKLEREELNKLRNLER